MSTLLLLTKHFPYNQGETAAESYLETEITYLAQSFDKVFVAATEAPANRDLTCTLPANVESVSLGCVQSKSQKIRAVVQGLCIPVAGTTNEKEAARSEQGLRVSRKLFQLYFIAKAQQKNKRLQRILADRGVNPTHLYSFWFFDTALVEAWILRQFPNAIAVSRTHRYELYAERNKLNYLPLREYLLNAMDAVLPCSQDGTSYLQKRYPKYSEKLHTCYLGTRELPDKSAEIEGQVFQVVSCSRVVPVKRVSLLAEAMKILDQQENIHVQWTHYGDGLELDAVKSIASSYKHVKAVFPGNLANSALLNEYGNKHVDLFVNVSSSEGLPISIMEASGCGVPVLATDVGGTHEIVQSGYNGELLDEHIDARTVAEKIYAYIGLPRSRKEQYRKAAREMWKEHFRTGSNVQTLLQKMHQ